MSAGLMSCVRENSPPMTMENSGAASLSSKSQGSIDFDGERLTYTHSFVYKVTSRVVHREKDFLSLARVIF